MERPFDPTLKTLAELSPADSLPLVKRRRRRVTVEDSDVGTIVSGATDKLFRVHDDHEYLLHLDFEAGHFRAELPLRLRLYNSVFEYRHRRVVLSAAVLAARRRALTKSFAALDLRYCDSLISITVKVKRSKLRADARQQASSGKVEVGEGNE
jgi:hypothetical protein